jgi:hypothetical protein
VIGEIRGYLRSYLYLEMEMHRCWARCNQSTINPFSGSEIFQASGAAIIGRGQQQLTTPKFTTFPHSAALV